MLSRLKRLEHFSACQTGTGYMYRGNPQVRNSKLPIFAKGEGDFSPTRPSFLRNLKAITGIALKIAYVYVPKLRYIVEGTEIDGEAGFDQIMLGSPCKIRSNLV